LTHSATLSLSLAAIEGMEIAGEFVEVETGKGADGPRKNVHSFPPPFVRPNSSGLTLWCPNWNRPFARCTFHFGPHEQASAVHW